MPEGDTIRRLAAAIEHRFVGQTIRRSIFRHPSVATASLDGLQLESADARGKHLLVRFSDERTLHAHMLMQGRIAFRRATEVPEWRRRFEFELESGVITGVDVPKLELIKTRTEAQALAFLGPDLCGVYDHAAAVRRLKTAGARPLGEALLDQRIIAGFGNIYAVETPFICGISPFQPINSITDVERVVTVGAALIRTNARRGPQRTTGQSRVPGDHWVLSSNRRRCLVCGDQLIRYRSQATPWRRRTAVCPACQPVTRQRTVDQQRVQRLLRVHPAWQTMDIEAAELLIQTDEPVAVERVTPT